ncbi:MAG: amidohydrolase [Crocinitomicaceae bacterium]|nr:amidohydrolase [Crocinitomicaceae bacterium]
MKGQRVDLIVHNAVIHSMDENLTMYEAMAIKDGKIVELGPERQILNKYSSDDSYDAGGRDIYPGLTDAHVHLLLGAKQRMGVDLSQCKSFSQLLMDVEMYQQRKPSKVIVGHGWNESLWRNNELLTNDELNKLFPKTPVCLFRNDSHTALVNDALLNLAGITSETVVVGGEVVKIDGKPTGIVTDAALELIKAKLPNYSLEELKEKVIEIQNELLMYGVTNVHDAGLEASEVKMYQQLIDDDRFKLNLYGMLLPTTENIQFAKKNKVFEYKNLTIRSFKIFVDGALGSRGAYLKAPYSDNLSTNGYPTITKEKLDEMVRLCMSIGYQLNAHAIGDAAVKLVLDAYQPIHRLNPDHRWRIEHAQVIDKEDLPLFLEYGVIPSVQPIQGVSDYGFAEQRLGSERLKTAYAYHSLLKTTGVLLIGSDFPIEDFDPFKALYAACVRKNEREQPAGGFAISESISLDDFLRGVTTWSAIGSFQESKLGSLEVGKEATFAIFEREITVPKNFIKNFSIATYINGEKVYSIE